MLAKALWNGRGASKSVGIITKRGVYTQATEPKVFINKHTKVICQGMTGKHVRYLLTSFRERSTLKGPSHTAPTW